jgi:hypothetical protein
MATQTEIDHIDPRWKEGRDYQLVCGLNISLNLEERDASLNASKSNRFLPWRVARDEVGATPVDQGDLCQFLNIETGEWVLEEFMGEWWFSQTRTLCGQSASGQNNKGRVKGPAPPSIVEGARQAGIKTYVEKTGIHAPGMSSKGGKAGKGNPGARKTNGRKTNSTKLICLITGKVSTSGPLTRYQTKRGISPCLRASLETVQFIIKALCLTTTSTTAKKFKTP